jgi:hypothetical protein
VRYEIRVASGPSVLLEQALGDFEVVPAPSGQTRLVGTIADEAALHGALHRLQNLHVAILELRRLDV